MLCWNMKQTTTALLPDERFSQDLWALMTPHIAFCGIVGTFSNSLLGIRETKGHEMLLHFYSSSISSGHSEWKTGSHGVCVPSQIMQCKHSRWKTEMVHNLEPLEDLHSNWNFDLGKLAQYPLVLKGIDTTLSALQMLN